MLPWSQISIAEPSSMGLVSVNKAMPCLPQGPYTVKKRVYELVYRVESEGLSASEVETEKKLLYSDFIKSLSGSESAAYRMLTSQLDGVDMLSFPDRLNAITPADAAEEFARAFKAFGGACAFSVIESDK